jgi:Peptidase_C39 like family
MFFKLFLVIILMNIGLITHVQSLVYHQQLKNTHCASQEYIMTKEESIPFDDLIVSWNAFRPATGKYQIQVSVKTEEWSPWMHYAEWGRDSQTSYPLMIYNDVTIEQDTIEVHNGKKGTAFRVKITPCDGASLYDFHALHVCVTNRKAVAMTGPTTTQDMLDLKVRGLSQMILQHPRAKSLCSPMSVTSIINYLSSSRFDPLQVGASAYDMGENIYGNWALNTAAAYDCLKGSHQCWVERLSSFDQVLDSLRAGFPVAASIRSPIKGSAQEYPSGHFIVIKGYDAVKRKVICLDPAFPENELTEMKYDLDDFLAAWSRRGYVSYIFAAKE